jgi:hypothetical protein
LPRPKPRRIIQVSEKEAAMLQILLLALAFNGASPQERGLVNGPDPIQGPTPVTDKDLLKMSVPRCANPREEQRAMEAQMKHMTPECLIVPRKRGGDTLDRSQQRP